MLRIICERKEAGSATSANDSPLDAQNGQKTLARGRTDDKNGRVVWLSSVSNHRNLDGVVPNDLDHMHGDRLNSLRASEIGTIASRGE